MCVCSPSELCLLVSYEVTSASLNHRTDRSSLVLFSSHYMMSLTCPCVSAQCVCFPSVCPLISQLISQQCRVGLEFISLLLWLQILKPRVSGLKAGTYRAQQGVRGEHRRPQLGSDRGLWIMADKSTLMWTLYCKRLSVVVLSASPCPPCCIIHSFFLAARKKRASCQEKRQLTAGRRS